MSGTRVKMLRSAFKVNGVYKITKFGPRKDIDPEEASLSQIATRQWAVGFLLMPVRKGHSVVVERFLTEGRIARGIYSTSPVVEIEAPFITTEHSVYKLEEVEKIQVFIK